MIRLFLNFTITVSSRCNYFFHSSTRCCCTLINYLENICKMKLILVLIVTCVFWLVIEAVPTVDSDTLNTSGRSVRDKRSYECCRWHNFDVWIWTSCSISFSPPQMLVRIKEQYVDAAAVRYNCGRLRHFSNKLFLLKHLTDSDSYAQTHVVSLSRAIYLIIRSLNHADFKTSGSLRVYFTNTRCLPIS